MKYNKGFFTASFLVLLFVFYPACGPKVMVPPAIQLTEYDLIGMIEFSTNVRGKLGEYVTGEFIEMIQPSHPGVRILELGSEESVLEAVDHEELNIDAIKAIGEKYNVTSVFTGDLDVTNVKPKVSFSPWVKSLSVKAEVEALLSVRLLDTESSATIWRSSVRGKKDVAEVTMFSDGPFIFDADDPEEAYGDLAEWLVEETTYDLRIRYERQ